MAEIELSVLDRQCLDRRIGDKATLVSEVAAWETARDAPGHGSIGGSPAPTPGSNSNGYTRFRYDGLLEAVLGQDFNSVYTVSRLSDNTLRIRIGAQHQTASQYASISRTNNVTVLLLIPEKLVNEKVRVVGRTSMVDAYTREPLPVLSTDAVPERAENVLNRHQLGYSATHLAAKILGAASLNDRALFDRYVRQETREDQRVFAPVAMREVAVVPTIVGFTQARTGFNWT